MSRILTALALFLLTAGFWSLSSAAAPGGWTSQDPGDSQDLAGVRQERAEALLAEGSHSKALEIYRTLDDEDPWVAFRLVDLAWRVEGSSDRPDEEALASSRKALEVLAQVEREEDRDRIFAEAQESLGDFHWTRRRAANFHQAWSHYQVAMDWWAGARDVERARGRWLGMVDRILDPVWYERQWRIGRYGNQLPVEVLEDALELATDTRRRGRLWLALAEVHRQGSWGRWSNEQARDAFEEALKIQDPRVRDEALIGYAEWLQSPGPWVRKGDESAPRPDLPGALVHLRALVGEYSARTSPFFHQAERSIESIVSPQLDLGSLQAFAPGSEVGFVLGWRNIDAVELRLVPVELARDLRFDEQQGPGAWRQALRPGQAVRGWRHETGDEGLHLPGSETLVLEPRPEPGAYLLEASARGIVRRELVLVSDTALVLKSTAADVIGWCVEASGGAPRADVPVTLFARTDGHEGRRWIRREARTDASGLVRFEGLVRKGSVECLAVVGQGGSQAMAEISASAREETTGLRVLAVTDRPAYRPGQTVQWKVLGRRHTGLVYETPAGQQVDYRLHGPRGDEIHRGELILSEFGSARAEFSIGAEAALGAYRVTFEAGGHHVGQAQLFRVEEYRRPEFEVTVELPRDASGKPRLYLLGDEVQAVVEASTYFGAPVSAAEVEVVVRQRPHAPDLRIPRPWDWFAASLGPDHRGYHRGPHQAYEVEVHRETLVTDDAGRVEVSFPTQEGAGQGLEYTIEARVTDAARRQVAGSGKVRVMRQSFAATLAPRGRIVAPGKSATLDLLVRDANGEPVAVVGRARLLRTRWVELWYDPLGQLRPRKDWLAERGRLGVPPPGWNRGRAETTYEEVAAIDLASGGDGMGVWSPVLPEEGSYVVRWTGPDPRGGEVTCETWVHACDESSVELSFPSEGLTLVLDRDAFATGEEGAVMVVAESSGRHVLFSVEGDTLIEHRVLNLEGSVQLVRLDIDARHVPNVTLSALGVWEGRVHQAQEDVVVPPREHFMKVDLALDREVYRPGESGTLSVRVTDADGEPVRSEVALSLIDASLLGLYPDQNPDPRKFFFGHRRGNEVQTRTPLFQRPYVTLVQRQDGTLVDRILADNEAFYDKPGDRRMRQNEPMPASETAFAGLRALGYAGEEMAASDAFAPGRSQKRDGGRKEAGAGGGGPAVVVRSDFRETALWLPDAVTDAQGRAQVKVTFPDSTTRWRASAQAGDAGARFGDAREDLARTSSPLVLRLAAPRFLVEGDEVTLSVTVDNTTEASLRAGIELQVEGLELLGWIDGDQLHSEEPPLVEINGSGQARLEWRARATRTGQAVLTATVVAGDAADGMERVLPVLEYGSEVLVAGAGKLEGAEVQHLFELPAERRSTRAAVTLAPSLATTMLDALPYLVQYPYGCTEQTLSRFVPTLVARRTLVQLGIAPEDIAGRVFGGIEREFVDRTHPADTKHKGAQDLARLDAMVASGLERITGLQRGDGGWGWWSGGDPDPWMTAYAVWSLSMARDCGVDLPDGVLERGTNWLEEHLLEESRRLDLAAWMLFAQVRATVALGREPTEVGERVWTELWTRREGLNAYTRALLALTTHALGKEAEAAILVRNLADGVRRASGGGSFLGSGGPVLDTAHWGEDGLFWRWSDGGVEATAFALRALLAIDPENELIDESCAWLVQNRRGAQWKSTRDTAITVLALCDYLKTTGESSTPSSFQVELDGVAVAEVVFEAGWNEPRRIELPEARDGSNRLTLRRLSGEGPLYWNLEVPFFSTERPIPARGHHLFVRRDVYRLVGRRTLLKGEVFDRVPLEPGATMQSGERVEVVLTLEAKNDLEYVMVEDPKAAGWEATEFVSGASFSAFELRASEAEHRFGRGGAADRQASGTGRDRDGVSRTSEGRTGRRRHVHRELRDDRAAYFLDRLPAGFWELRATLRAESPGVFQALPARAEAMYVPEIRGNGRSLEVRVAPAE